MKDGDADGGRARLPSRWPVAGTAIDASDHDPEIRHDPLSLRTVVVAPRRMARPVQFGGSATSPDACPFCAGHEHLTPPDVLRVEHDGAWLARIVPNRYPVVEDLPTTAAGVAADVRPARGIHEVVVESPDHLRSILSIPSDRWQTVWRLVRDRLAMLSTRHDIAWATVFKNSGERAGASLEHVHSQVVALDFVPSPIVAEARASATVDGSFDALLRQAARDSRVVAEHGGLVAIVPPAPRQPLECWILPSHSQPRLHRADDQAVDGLAFLTRWFVERLERLAPGADFNWWLHDAPFHHAAAFDGNGWGGWHWHLEMLPRLAALAGFELGTGCHITTLPPREAAKLLRGV